MASSLHTHSGLMIAKEVARIVHGGRGSYFEFEHDQVVDENIHVPADQQWRQTPNWQDQVFYDEWRSNDKCNVKLYFQRKFVGYADYNPGMWYVSVDEATERPIPEGDDAIMPS